MFFSMKMLQMLLLKQQLKLPPPTTSDAVAVAMAQQKLTLPHQKGSLALES